MKYPPPRYNPDEWDDPGAYYFLEARWGLTLLEHGSFSTPNQENVFQELVLRYSSSPRHYHGLSHLEACFTVLDAYFPNNTDRSLELAIWFHDFVYDTGSSDNEGKSAKAAAMWLDTMGFSRQVQDEVASLILMTRHTALPSTDQEKILIDVDLSILGESPEVFDTYEIQIREEYDWVPLDHFQDGRKKVLQSFLDRDKIFLTEPLQAAGYELRARANIARSLAKLPPGPPLQSW